MKIKVKVSRLDPEFKDLPLPEYKTSGSAGMDLYAALKDEINIMPGCVELIPTNLSIEIPEGFECQVRSRSGLAIKNKVFCLNSPGTIDSDYRGEVKVILANFGKEPFPVKKGDRIAQIVFAKHGIAEWSEVDNLEETTRGAGGFGSTGK